MISRSCHSEIVSNEIQDNALGRDGGFLVWLERKTARREIPKEDAASENPLLSVRLVRSLYGTRDAPQLWAKHVCGTLRGLGYPETKGAPGGSGIRVLEVYWWCTSVTSWSLATKQALQDLKDKLQAVHELTSDYCRWRRSRPKGRNLSRSYYSLAGVVSGVRGLREACSGTIEMHWHGDVQARELAHECRGLFKDDGQQKTLVSSRHRARSLHVAGPSRPQCSSLSVRHEKAATNRVRLGKVEAIVQI